MKIMFKSMRLAWLVFFITFLALPIQSLADSEEVKYDTTVSIGHVQGSVGDVVNVPVKITAPKKEIASYGIEINYDKDALKVVGITAGYGIAAAGCENDESQAGCFWSNYDNNEGFLRGAWVDPSGGEHPINQAINLFTIQVEIENTDFIGEKNLTVQVDNPESLAFTDPSNLPLSVGVEKGIFSIVKSTKGDSTVVAKPSNETNMKGSLPKTGDDSFIDIILNVIIAALLVILLTFWIYRKRQSIQKK